MVPTPSAVLGSSVDLSGANELATPNLASDPETRRVHATVMAGLFGDELEAARIGRYSIIARIGQGAMGIVYACYDADLERRIAVKVVPRAALTKAADHCGVTHSQTSKSP